jgi:hypothetical protein
MAVARTVPFRGITMQTTIEVEGYEPPPGQVPVVPMNQVTPGYFDVMGMRLVAGRDFEATDQPATEKVVVINETFARAYGLPDNPIGWPITVNDDPATVIGMVADAKYQSPSERSLPHLWIPLSQYPAARLIVHLRGQGDPVATMARLREAVHAIDPELTIVSMELLEQVVADVTLPERVLSAGLAGAGSLALVLAALGIYGSVSHLVAQRSRELGIRRAVGATDGSVIVLVLRQGIRLIAFGLVGGAAVAVAVGGLLRSLVAGTAGLQPILVLTAVALLAIVAVLASLVPAMCAARIDPIATLRTD